MAPNPLLAIHCANCGREVARSLTRRPKRVCASCQRARTKAYRAEHSRPTGVWMVATYLTTENAQRRQVADATLDNGGTKRHCSCGRMYELLTFDTPCPSCGDHLIPLPGVA